MAPKQPSSDRLKARRRVARLRLRILLSVVLVLLIAGFFYLLWQPYLRISHVTVNDVDASIVAEAQAELHGTYARIIPRDSYFFAPEQAIRAAILKTHPELEAVSIARAGLTALSITVSKRVPIARWCGTPSAGDAQNSLAFDATALPGDACYLFDATGYLYSLAAVDGAVGTNPSLVPLSDLKLYSVTSSASSTEPIGATLTDAKKVPAILELARSIASFGAMARAIVIRGDEVDLFLTRGTGTTTDALGTRITYVLGDEQGAFSLASSAFSQLNLKDGSIEYVDLRFSSSGRVYVKKNTK